MRQVIEKEEQHARAPGLGQRFRGVLLSPSRVFPAVVDRPAWLSMLLLVVLVPVVCDALFFQFEMGRLALVDREANRLEWFGRPVSDEVWYGMQENVGGLAWRWLLITFAGGALGAPALAAALWLLLGQARGVAFRQVLAVVAHSGAVLATRWMVVTPLRFRYESLNSPLNLATIVPMLDEGSVVARLLGAIDLFVLWWLIVLARGLSVAYGRPARPLALRMVAAYGAVGAVVAVIGTILGGA